MNIDDTDSAGNEDVENNATTSSEKATPGRVSENTQSHFGTAQTKIKDALMGSAGRGDYSRTTAAHDELLDSRSVRRSVG